jgi:RNA polymerase sigma-70 factor, ECF subfamily
MPDANEITQLLLRVGAGDPGATAHLLEAVYPELRRIAGYQLRGERPGHTIQPTALVNEAYLDLLAGAKLTWKDRAHFFATVAQAMRRILVDYARMRKAAKREGGKRRVELTDGLAISVDRLDEVLSIDEALTRLAEWDARQSRIVELRFFGGLTEEEVAETLGISARTVKRDWNLARAWLRGELQGQAGTAEAGPAPG